MDTIKGRTWLQPEEYAYPSGGFSGRKARVVLRANPYTPDALRPEDIGKLRVVAVSIPDTFFSIPARLRLRGRTVRGFVSVVNGADEFSFTPEADERG